MLNKVLQPDPIYTHSGVLGFLALIAFGSGYGYLGGSGTFALSAAKASAISKLPAFVDMNGRIWPMIIGGGGGTVTTSLKGGLIGLAIGALVTGSITYLAVTSTPQYEANTFFEDQFGLE